MTPRTIKEWQRVAYELAVEKGFHSRECMHDGNQPDCERCNGTGRVPIDPHSPTRIASRLALIHCEISEAVECVARGRMELYWTNKHGVICPAPNCTLDTAFAFGTKPEGFPIELADVFLRLCDLAESLGATIHPTTDSTIYRTDPEGTAASLNGLHELLEVEHVISAPGLSLTPFYHRLWTIAYSHEIDLLAMAELKHEYNRTRPIRHGGKVL